MTPTGIRCKLCGHETRDYLGNHLLEDHELTVEAYLETHPGAPTISERLFDLHKQEVGSVRRERPPSPDTLSITWGVGAIPFKVNPRVPALACFSSPEGYRIPEHGELGEDVWHLTLALKDSGCPPIYVHGPSGCGKDAIFQHWSAVTRTPGILRSIIPGADIEPWFFSREFNADGTRWEEGPVLKALRDGYTCPDGTVVPYLFLISDFDRADRSQAEYLRLITAENRVAGPKGQVFPVLEGTRIAVTANSSGAGDPQGRYISANPLDATLLDRFDFSVKFHQLDWNDELPIVQSKFPLLVERCPTIFPKMGRITAALRKAIVDEVLYADFSHRSLCAVLKHAIRLISQCGEGKIPKKFLARSLRVWLDKLPDEDTRQTADNICDPYISGGLLEEGNTEFIGGSRDLDEW